jgi:phytanoyl-CoA hydroxylase
MEGVAMNGATRVLDRVRRSSRKWASSVRGVFVDRFAPLWIDAPDAREALAAKRFDPATRTALEQLIDTGLARLPGNVAVRECDALVEDFARYCAAHPEHREFQDANGLHDRLACFHMSSEAAREVGTNANTLKVLEAAFDATPAIVGSLYFERGSEQDVHRDTPAFFTVPLNHFFGVWTALEDIRPDSGKLVYYAGGHRAIADRPFVGSGMQNMERYFSDITEACKRAGLPLVEVEAKKGDTFIWHPQLPHGGSAIRNPALSRRSIVFHYAPVGVPCYGAEAFFSPAPPKARAPIDYVPNAAIPYFNQGAPRFFVNRKQGNFRE